mgnify:CR=1 FL=1
MMLERRGKIETIVIAVILIISLVFIIYTLRNDDSTVRNIASDNRECKFVTVQDYDNFSVVYNSANLVMYIISEDGHATVMVDDNNEPMIWKGRY